jgi:hypothetical protein
VVHETPLTLTCPLCSREHRYRLSVERSKVLGASADTGLPTVSRSFTRLFTCPEKGRFEARVTLTETALSRIKAVEVAG